MKININTGGGTPTYLTTRHGRGIALLQGTSKVMLSRDEIPALLQALCDVRPEGGWDNSGLEEMSG